MNDTIRVERSWTRWPASVTHSSSRRSTPSRKSRVRLNDSISAVESRNCSPSTAITMVLTSGTLTTVCPTRAKPTASSACRMSQVSWKPLMKVPWAYASTAPSSLLPRRPRYPLPTAKTVSRWPRPAVS